MSDTIIRVENLSKKYIIDHQKSERNNTLRDAITSGAKSFGQRLLGKSEKPSFDSDHEEFWALKDVSFEIKQGDRVGIIGHNGAGKSTLLKILSRITEPTTGRIQIKGRVASLLEVGTGFHPELTGRENIFLNGAILGMSKLEIQQKFNEIVEFAEISKFLDTPVKRYSSGMYVRLAFAVAAHLEPEVLVIDEVLAVGDTKFQKKCLGKMEDVAKQGRTILFVSHNLGILQTLCDRGILLKQGSLIVDDTAPKAVNVYLKNLEQVNSRNLLERTDRKGQGQVRLTHVEVSISKGDTISNLATGYPAQFIFHLTGKLPKLSCAFTLYDQHGQPIISFNSLSGELNCPASISSNTQIVCDLDELLLLPGSYRMNVVIMSENIIQDHIEAATVIEVEQGQLRGRPVCQNTNYGSVCMPHQWLLQ